MGRHLTIKKLISLCDQIEQKYKDHTGHEMVGVKNSLYLDEECDEKQERIMYYIQSSARYQAYVDLIKMIKQNKC